jgi:hypothetical protein
LLCIKSTIFIRFDHGIILYAERTAEGEEQNDTAASFQTVKTLNVMNVTAKTECWVKTATTTLQAEVQHAAVNPKDSASQNRYGRSEKQ